jgi:acyl-CoA synthetase (AMP-forming)/AMP-acid ligase II
VENTLYADDRVSEAAAVGVPDIRLGELVAAVVSIKPGNEEITEASLIKLAQKRSVALWYMDLRKTLNASVACQGSLFPSLLSSRTNHLVCAMSQPCLPWSTGFTF